ncbi:MAG: 3'-5' exonuclease [Pseudobdellovibrionaceae bacterium]
MYLLGIDFETTGLSADTDHIIEVGAVIWDADQKKTVEVFSKLIQIGDQKLPEQIIELTGITDQYLRDFGAPLEGAIDQLIALSMKCDFLVGHNALGFDMKFLEKACQKVRRPMINRRWIDTTIDIDFPKEIKTRKLSYLAADHKFMCSDSHRAVFDVITMFQIMSKYDIQEICDRAQSELVTVIAKVSYDHRTQASEKGFRWDPLNKTWSKSMRQYDLKKANFPFEVDITI